jgi:hypothetical protein
MTPQRNINVQPQSRDYPVSANLAEATPRDASSEPIAPSPASLLETVVLPFHCPSSPPTPAPSSTPASSSLQNSEIKKPQPRPYHPPRGAKLFITFEE